VPDETVYKRGDKGREISKKVRAKSLKLRFKNRSININTTITIGRDDKSDICVKDDPLISRHHAFIEKEGEHYYIMDKGSTNGTYLNNNPLPRCERVRISSGDVITVGKTSLAIQ
jgi:pSer/pThr/pTyr-binding forkhead associated (FHA) protein